MREKPSHLLSRRKWIVRSSAAAAVTIAAPFAAPYVSRRAHASLQIAKGDNIFGLGIASGDPLPDSIVLWTRLAPKPVKEDGGMPNKSFEVSWEIAEDEKLTKTVQKGKAITDPAWGHSVHVDVRGLNPARLYWYRFQVGNQASAIGRTKTAPAFGAAIDQVKFAFTSCQKYEEGYYTAHKHLAQEDLDFVLFLGDYIYEKPAKAGKPRSHDLDLAETLVQYRQRYGVYKSDADLQACHAAHPWIMTWDDHEFANDYANNYDGQNDETAPEYMVRRVHAYKAYYEHMPLRKVHIPRGPHMQLYRRFAFGDLISMNILDTRQYRTPQPCGNKFQEMCDEASDPKAKILGKKQEQWLLGGLASSKACWNVLGQQVPLMRRNYPKRGNDRYNMDKWDGYRENQSKLVNFLDEKKIANPVVLTGDVHTNFAGELKKDYDDPSSKTIGCEFITTSISSKGDGYDVGKKGRKYLKNNDHLKFYNRQRGYSVSTVTKSQWRNDFRIVDYISRPGAPIKTRASFAIEAGKPGLEKV
jgi:alkaline phosphatase D